jgi:hypothetical protein
MNGREADELLVAELLQARDAVRCAAIPSHFDFGLTLGMRIRLDVNSISASWPEVSG